MMTTEYEISGMTRDDLILTKGQLIVDAPIVRHWASKKELPPDIGFEGVDVRTHRDPPTTPPVVEGGRKA